MEIIDNRKAGNSEDLLKKRFTQKILREESRELDQNQRKLMLSRGFSSEEFYTGRFFDIDDTTLKYRHRTILRFVDMKTRQTKEGVKKKTAHPVHNAPLYGMANTIVRRLSFEYTERMRQTLLSQSPG